MCAEVMTIHLLSSAMLHKGLLITKDSITNYLRTESESGKSQTGRPRFEIFT